MKTFAAILIAVLLGASGAFAHEQHEHPPGPGLFGHPPEHIHVLLNPMPVYGMMIGVLALAGALIARSRAARILALSIVVVAGASAWPTQHFGENAYQNIRKISDEQGQLWLDEHMGRAERFLFLFYGTALLGIAAFATQRKFPRTAASLTIITLVAGIASAGIGGWISRAGGHIRHSEFRHGEAPSKEGGGHEHGEGKQSHETMQHDKTQHSDTNASHKHGATDKEASEKPDAEKAQLPDTLEGVWKHIHEHHAELEAAITGKKFTDIQTHVQHLTELTKRLAELSQHDRKATAERGVNQLNQVLAEIKNSAETGSELVLKTKFDAFVKSLSELEQQMKTQ